MRKGWVLLAAGVFALSAVACQKKGENEKVTSDTSTISGRDTVNGRSLPATDTVVKTTTTEVDTMQGKAKADTAKKDTAKSKKKGY